MQIPKLEKLRGSRMLIGNSSCGLLSLWSGIVRGHLPLHRLIQDILTPKTLIIKKVTPDPVIIECSGLGGGDLNLAQPSHVCANKLDLMRSALRVDYWYELWIELAMTGESLTGCCYRIELAMTGESLTGCCYLGGYRTMCGRRCTERR